ncbi:MAG TPA: hypothetical protein VF172_08630 [Nitrososphaera sp.]
MAQRNKKALPLNIAAAAVVASALMIAFTFVVVPYLTTAAQQPQNEERRILALDSKYDYAAGGMVTRIDYVKVGDMQPNTAYWFLDPFGKTMEGNSASNDILKPGSVLDLAYWDIIRENEPFEFYTIIRLPEWLGGDKDDISAYRTYSMVAISDQCLSRYWGNDGRWRIENPCAGDLYRPWDGIAMGGPAAVGITGRSIVSAGHFNGLASLDLSVDSEGYITAKRPNRDYFSNGMVGEGRRFTADMMQESNEEMARAAGAYAGYILPFPASISSTHHYLADLRPITDEPQTLQYPTDHEVPQTLEAVYYTSPSGGDTGYSEVIIRSYRLDIFPELSLDSPKMTTGRIDISGQADDNQHLKLNQTTVDSLIHLGWYDNNNNRPRIVQSGADIAGDFSLFIAPVEIQGGEVVGSGALIWGRSLDGKDILVTIRASSMNMEELVALGETLPML